MCDCVLYAAHRIAADTSLSYVLHAICCLNLCM